MELDANAMVRRSRDTHHAQRLAYELGDGPHDSLERRRVGELPQRVEFGDAFRFRAYSITP
jgi:hypothetical protein